MIIAPRTNQIAFFYLPSNSRAVIFNNPGVIPIKKVAKPVSKEKGTFINKINIEIKRHYYNNNGLLFNFKSNIRVALLISNIVFRRTSEKQSLPQDFLH
jgi:hypothetical protein